MELRCTNKLHGILRDADVVEMKCDSKFCGHRPGSVVVIHRFNVHTGELVETLKFRNPIHDERSADGAGNERTAVRSA